MDVIDPTDSNDTVDELLSYKRTLLCVERVAPILGLISVAVFDALMIKQLVNKGFDTITREQLSIIAAINLALLLICIAGFAYQCVVSYRRLRSKPTDDTPPCLNGHLIRSDLNTTCPICLDEIQETILFLTPCQHKFHPQCLQECLENAIHQCPICRKPISTVANDPTNLQPRRFA